MFSILIKPVLCICCFCFTINTAIVFNKEKTVVEKRHGVLKNFEVTNPIFILQ